MKKKMITVILALVLAFSIAGATLAVEPSAPLMHLQKGMPQESCPVVGGKINKDLYVDYQGRRVYFCCPSCIEVFKKDPEKYLQKLRDPGIAPEKSPGTK